MKKKTGKKRKHLTKDEFDKFMRGYFAQPEVQQFMAQIMIDFRKLSGLNDAEIESLSTLSRQEFFVKVMPLLKDGERRQSATATNTATLQDRVGTESLCSRDAE